MGRPKNSKDVRKRKRKTILSGTNERQLIDDYESGVLVSDLTKKYNVTRSYISNMFKRRNIRKRIDQSIVQQWTLIDNLEDLEKKLSGIYSIYFINKTDYNDIKLYIGSSTNVRTRLLSHIKDLKNKNHYSSMLLEYFNNEKYQINYAVIEECAEDKILERETFYLHEYNRSCLLNSWRPVVEEDLRPWLEKAITYSSYAKNYTINSVTGCKETNCVHKSGYGRMAVTIGESKDKGQTKYFYKHRVAFWEKYKEYPELIRHKCNNPRCYNADHLEKGNHRDNGLDKRGDFPKIFEDKWVELKGDLVKLTQHFGDRWNGKQMWRGKLVSYAIYDWEKKLDLRKKYPEILDTNTDRRFSLSYQKLGICKKKKI